jgi:hypothetical protein
MHYFNQQLFCTRKSMLAERDLQWTSNLPGNPIQSILTTYINIFAACKCKMKAPCMNFLQKDSIFLLLPFWEQATSSLQKKKEWWKETEWEMLAKSG